MRGLTKSILSLILIVATLSSCNDTDDVVKIFTKDTKKLTMLLIATSTNPKEQDLWGGNVDAKERSMKLKNIDGNYELIFDSEGEADDGIIRGKFTGRAVNTKLNGTWSADGKTNKMSIRLDQNIGPNTESDVLAKDFIRSLNKVYKYQGDSQSLSLFYDEKSLDGKKFMGFYTMK